MEMDYKLTRTKRKSCARTRALPVLTHLRHRRANFAVTHNTLTGEKLLAGEIDVAFILASSDSPAVRQLLDDERIVLAGYPRADAMVALYPFLHRVVIPRGAGNSAASPTRSSNGRLSHSRLQSVRVSLWAWPAVPLLQARRERPRRRAAEERDELAPFHSITSSASCWRCKGMSRPITLADFRLSASSNVVVACTGRSAGFSPLRIRST